jgi:hypothetical protein
MVPDREDPPDEDWEDELCEEDSPVVVRQAVTITRARAKISKLNFFIFCFS